MQILDANLWPWKSLLYSRMITHRHTVPNLHESEKLKMKFLEWLGCPSLLVCYHVQKLCFFVELCFKFFEQPPCWLLRRRDTPPREFVDYVPDPDPTNFWPHCTHIHELTCHISNTLKLICKQTREYWRTDPNKVVYDGNLTPMIPCGNHELRRHRHRRQQHSRLRWEKWDQHRESG